MKFFVIKIRSVACVCLAAVALCLFAVTSFNANIAASVPSKTPLPIYSVECDQKKLSITFDCAWEDNDTDKIIEVLNEKGACATFFVTGDYAERCAESVKKFSDAGFEIANHSYSHLHPNAVSKEELTLDTEKCSTKIEELTGKKPTLYRAPYGEYNDSVVDTINSMGYRFIQWDTDSLDYTNISTDEILKRMKKAKNGSILLFHTGPANTPEALSKTIDMLKDEGYSFCAVSELIYPDNCYIDSSGRQHSN